MRNEFCFNYRVHKEYTNQQVLIEGLLNEVYLSPKLSKEKKEPR